MLLLLTITHAAREETITRSSTEMKVITKVIQMARKKWICCAALIIY